MVEALMDLILTTNRKKWLRMNVKVENGPDNCDDKMIEALIFSKRSKIKKKTPIEQNKDN